MNGWYARLRHPNVTEWLRSPHPIGSPESRRLARRAQIALGWGVDFPSDVDDPLDTTIIEIEGEG